MVPNTAGSSPMLAMVVHSAMSNVGDGHDGHDDGGDDGDALRAAENDESGEHDEHDAHADRRAVGGVVGDVVLERRSHVERLQAVEAEGEAQDEQPRRR